MPYEVVFLSEAQQDLDLIAGYLATHFSLGLTRWFDALEETIVDLEQHPLRYARAPEDHLVSAPIQSLTFQPKAGKRYRLVFTIVENEVRVLRILGPGHDLLRADEL
jgi:plasmid stabilization system protein ParE